MAVEVRKRGRWLALLAALALAGCGPQDDDGADEAPIATGRVLNVEVAAVEPRDFSELIRLSGTVVANRDVVVSAEESGIVTAVLVEKGSQVTQGQPIARIDDRLLSSQVAQATAQATLAGEIWTRRRGSSKMMAWAPSSRISKRSTRPQQADAALATLQRRLERPWCWPPSRVSWTTARLRSARRSTRVPRWGASWTSIRLRSPLACPSGTRPTSAQVVGPRSPSTPSRSRGLRPRSASWGATVNPSNRTFPVELRLPNPGRAVKPEMVADVEVVRRVVSDALVVPRDAVVRSKAATRPSWSSIRAGWRRSSRGP